MIEEATLSMGKPISFKNLGKKLKRPTKAKPKFSIKMSDFAQFGYCPYTAWHLSSGTTPIIKPALKQAIEAGTVAHDKMDVEHEEKVFK